MAKTSKKTSNKSSNKSKAAKSKVAKSKAAKSKAAKSKAAKSAASGGAGGARKRPQTKGLRPTAVARVLKAGTGEAKGDVRVTKDAAKAATLRGEQMLKDLGTHVSAHLSVSGKKTVTPEILATCIKDKMACEGVSAKVAGLGQSSKSKTKSTATRHPITVASALRSFAKGCPLGRNAMQITDSAKDSMALVIGDYIKRLGTDSWRYTHLAGRKTIKASDILACIDSRN